MAAAGAAADGALLTPAMRSEVVRCLVERTGWKLRLKNCALVVVVDVRATWPPLYSRSALVTSDCLACLNQ